MTDRKLVLGALTWCLGILLAAYLYRVTITDPQFVQVNQSQARPTTTQPITVNH